MWNLWKLVVLSVCASLVAAGQVAAQTYVQSNTTANGSGGNDAATFSTAPASGNTIVAGLVCYGPSNCTLNSMTDNFGNTYSKIGPTASYGGPTANVTNVTLYCASGISTGSSFTVTANLTNSGGDSNLYIAEYSGASCNVDQSASGSLTDGTATTSLQTSSATTTNAADLLVVVAGSSAGGAATAGSGFQLRQNGNTGGAENGGFEDRTVTATGSYSGSMTLASTTTYWAMVMVALKNSSGTAPTVTSFTPTSGAVGTSVTITGTNFTGATAVKFNGTAATTFTVNSATQITATVPTGATTGTISVTTSAGTGTSSSSFTVTTSGGGPIAYVQSQTAALSTGGNLSTTFATAPTAGNTIVVGSACYGPSNCTISSITDNYSNTYTKIGPTASFGGPTNITNATLYCATGIATGSNFTVTSNQSNSGGDSNLYIAEYSGASCNVDQSASGSLTDGTATNTLQTGATPTTTNAADLLVAVGAAYEGGTATAGTGFSLRQNGSSAAEFGGYEDRIVSATGAYTGSMTLASTTTYWAMTMVALKGSTSGGGTPPAITSISQSSGQIYSIVTITGTNLGSSANNATFNGVTAGSDPFGTQSNTTLTVYVPYGATTGNLVVTTSAGTSNAVTFTVTPGPAIQSMPNWGTVGAPITISGSGFGTTTGSVSFNGVNAAITAWSATSITATVPLTATQGWVIVTANGVSSLTVPGTGNANNPTYFCPGPVITSVTPTAAPVGTVVTINGSRLTPTSQVQFGNSTVTFNGTVGAQEGLGVPLTGATTWTDTQIVLPVPTGATSGSIVVSVRVQGTGFSPNITPGASSNPLQFNVGNLPSITSLSAVGGSGGSTLTLTGSNFGSTQGTVVFQNADIGGNTNASITSWSATSIVISVPSTLPIGEFDVQVVNSVGPSNTEPFWITGAGCPTTW